jgi:hypothetical protein
MLCQIVDPQQRVASFKVPVARVSEKLGSYSESLRNRSPKREETGGLAVSGREAAPVSR